MKRCPRAGALALFSTLAVASPVFGQLEGADHFLNEHGHPDYLRIHGALPELEHYAWDANCNFIVLIADVSVADTARALFEPLVPVGERYQWRECAANPAVRVFPAPHTQEAWIAARGRIYELMRGIEAGARTRLVDSTLAFNVEVKNVRALHEARSVLERDSALSAFEIDVHLRDYRYQELDRPAAPPAEVYLAVIWYYKTVVEPRINDVLSPDHVQYRCVWFSNPPPGLSDAELEELDLRIANCGGYEEIRLEDPHAFVNGDFGMRAAAPWQCVDLRIVPQTGASSASPLSPERRENWERPVFETERWIIKHNFGSECWGRFPIALEAAIAPDVAVTQGSDSEVDRPAFTTAWLEFVGKDSTERFEDQPYTYPTWSAQGFALVQPGRIGVFGPEGRLVREIPYELGGDGPLALNHTDAGIAIRRGHEIVEVGWDWEVRTRRNDGSGGSFGVIDGAVFTSVLDSAYYLRRSGPFDTRLLARRTRADSRIDSISWKTSTPFHHVATAGDKLYVLDLTTAELVVFNASGHRVGGRLLPAELSRALEQGVGLQERENGYLLSQPVRSFSLEGGRLVLRGRLPLVTVHPETLDIMMIPKRWGPPDSPHRSVFWSDMLLSISPKGEVRQYRVRPIRRGPR